jgi:arylsulfatase A-like enzyme
MELPPIKIGENVPEQALRRQNDKIWGMNDIQQRKTISGYMASVRFMDQQVGRLLDALDRLGLREETIVIFLSDHGYNLGEHDCWSKSSLWEGSIRVPLVISVPGKKYENHYGTTRESIVELLDIYPTLADLGGLAPEIPEILQGKSLVDHLLNREEKTKDNYAYTIANPGAATIRTGKWRYTRWGEKIEDGNEELYDHSNDPEEQVNLIDDKSKAILLEEIRGKFEMARERARSGLK